MKNESTNNLAKVKIAAQDILSRRDHSEKELREKLRKKGMKQGEIDQTMDWLITKNYVNDERMAMYYVERIVERKAVGPMWIKAKLRQKGIASEIIDLALEEKYGDKQALKEKAIATWKKTHVKHAEDKYASSAS